MRGASSSSLMKIKTVGIAKKTYPTGDPSFSVQQAFPAGIEAEDCDPFLMCDYFAAPSRGVALHPDQFDVPWHPHRGFDLATFMKVRSLCFSFKTESFQSLVLFDTATAWAIENRFLLLPCSGLVQVVESSTRKVLERKKVGFCFSFFIFALNQIIFFFSTGKLVEGFQLWINVPSSRKMEDPRYGTVPSDQLPPISGDGIRGHVLAGNFNNLKGPFETVQPVQMLDIEVDAGKSFDFVADSVMDNCIVFIYFGDGKLNGENVKQFQVLRLDATSAEARIVHISADKGTVVKAMIFAGKRLNQPIAWHGPFVMTTGDEIRKTLKEYSNGQFPPKRVSWDYKNFADFPAPKE